MKTKEEVIKAAYGKHWEEIKDFIDENGWFQNNHDEDRFYFTFGNTSLDFEYNQDDTHLRPKELKGIEDNNGWINVKDELPKENGKFWVRYKGTPLSSESKVECYYLNKGWDSFLEVSQYRPYVEPPKPLYL